MKKCQHPVYGAGFEPTTFRTWVSYQNHKTRASTLKGLIFYFKNDMSSRRSFFRKYVYFNLKIDQRPSPPFPSSVGQKILEKAKKSGQKKRRTRCREHILRKMIVRYIIRLRMTNCVQSCELSMIVICNLRLHSHTLGVLWLQFTTLAILEAICQPVKLSFVAYL